MVQVAPRSFLLVLFAIAITTTYACKYNFRFTYDDLMKDFYINQKSFQSSITDNHYGASHVMNGQTWNSPSGATINVAARLHNNLGPGGLVFKADLLNTDNSVRKTFLSSSSTWKCNRPDIYCSAYYLGIWWLGCREYSQHDVPDKWWTPGIQAGWADALQNGPNGRVVDYHDNQLDGAWWIWGTPKYADNEDVVCASTMPCPTCGDLKIDSPAGIPAEVCDDGNTNSGDGCNQDCAQVEFGYTCPPSGGACQKIDMCKTYGPPTPLPASIATCVNDAAPGKFTVNCIPGYKITGDGNTVWSKTYTLPAKGAQFCDVSPFCTVYGFSNKLSNTQDCQDRTKDSSIPANQRILKCQSGYTTGAANTNNPSITLAGDTAFGGCTMIDTCAVWGPQTSTSVVSCLSALNKRTIKCATGYAVGGTEKTSSIVPVTEKVLTDTSSFVGCNQIDTCNAGGTYGYSGKTGNVSSCVASGHTRNITCARGFFPIGGDGVKRWIVKNGADAFGGCDILNECTRNGFSSRPNNTQSCETFIDYRIITCQIGYHAKGNTSNVSRMVIVEDDEEFLGCELINNCAVYGYSGKDKTGADTCVNGVDKRTITCLPGYALTGTSLTNKSNLITTWTGTPGNAVWPSCSLLDMCQLYGFSGLEVDDSIRNCVNNAPNQRNITCRSGYAPVSSTNAFITGGNAWRVLTGSDVFYGCALIPQCVVYGYSGKEANTQSCVGQPNLRTITCKDGYAAVPPANPVVSLASGAPFLGCERIDPCKVYGFSNTYLGAVSCVNDFTTPGFSRTLTCGGGYAAIPPSQMSITLGRNVTFTGCQVVDMCAAYGFSGNDQNVVSCVNGKPNERTITCAKYYAAPAHAPTIEGDNSQQSLTVSRLNPILLVGRVAFSGCNPICGDGYVLPEELCDDGNNIDGDGCSSTCTIEPGFICPTTVGQSVGTCCKEHRGILFANITCHNGDYISTDPTGTIRFDASDWVINNLTVTLCGDIVLSGNGTDPSGTPTLSLLPGSILTIQGTLTLADDAILAMSVNSSIVLQPYCSNYQTVSRKRQVSTNDQLHISPSAVIILVDPPTRWQADNWAYGASLFTLSHCTSVTSFNLIVANNKSTGFKAAKVPLITVPSSCTWRNDHRKTLSDSSYNLYDSINFQNSNTSFVFDDTHCAQFGSWATTDQWVSSALAGSYTTRWASWSKCTMSTAQIVGIAVGCSVGVLLILILIALVAGKGVGSTEDHYSAL